MKVTGVTMDPQGPTPIVILEALKGRQAFPIWIGMHEARAIALEIEGTSSPRPLTHSLLKNILTELQVNVVRVVIHDLHDNTFYASILLQHGDTTHTLDARPSDAIVLALGAKAPIYVTPQVLQSVHTVTLSPASASQASMKKLGMHIQSLDEKLVDVFHLDNADGVLVSFVEEDSQAARNGIRGGDVITEVDGQHIKGMDDLLGPFKDAKIGQEIVLQILRDRHPLLIRWRLSAVD
jgi:bifunctional DNase/RNase